jgi:hypothetical protein
MEEVINMEELMQAEELRGLNPEDFEKELIDQSILNAKN